jgi:hypothetical protein
MAWLRRMYARLLFVVVGISEPVLAVFRLAGLTLVELRLGIVRCCGYTHAA